MAFVIVERTTYESDSSNILTAKRYLSHPEILFIIIRNNNLIAMR